MFFHFYETAKYVGMHAPAFSSQVRTLNSRLYDKLRFILKAITSFCNDDKIYDNLSTLREKKSFSLLKLLQIIDL